MGDLSSIECSTHVIQSLAFIAGYAVHKYLKHHHPCHVCLDTLTFEKQYDIDILSLIEKLLNICIF